MDNLQAGTFGTQEPSTAPPGLRVPSNGKTIYHRPLNRSKTAELSQASFAYLFGEMVTYAQWRAKGIQELEQRCVPLRTLPTPSAAQPPRLSYRHQTPRPAPLPRTPPHAASAAEHCGAAAPGQAECVATPLRAAGRPARKVQQPGHAGRVHDHRQRAARQPVHQCAARDEPAQLCCLHRRRRGGYLRRCRLPSPRHCPHRRRGRHVARKDGLSRQVSARGCRARELSDQELSIQRCCGSGFTLTRRRPTSFTSTHTVGVMRSGSGSLASEALIGTNA